MGRLTRICKAMLRVAPLRLWVLIAAAPVMTLETAALVLIVWLGGWDDKLQGTQLDFVGWAMLGSLALLGVVTATIAAVKVSGHGPGGVGLEIDADGDDTP